MAPRASRRTSRALGAAVPTPIQSAYTTPISSAFPSAYASEVEQDDDEMASAISRLMLKDPSIGAVVKKPKLDNKPFPFLSLPSELRIEIYGYHFAETPSVVDLEPDNYRRIHKKLALLRVCRTIYAEASHVFFTTHTFRVFPTTPGRYFKTKRPLLARLKPRQRANITSLELRLGPGWHKPPKGWVVNPALGLADCTSVRKLTVYVECDPGDSMFNGFRHSDGFYEGFSQGLLTELLRGLPLLKSIHFDAWSGVNKSGGMVRGLLEVAAAHGREICAGPERGWTDLEEEVLGRDSHAAAATATATAAALLGGANMNVVVVA